MLATICNMKVATGQATIDFDNFFELDAGTTTLIKNRLQYRETSLECRKIQTF